MFSLVFYILAGSFVLVYLTGVAFYFRKKKVGKMYQADEVTVIIPFRNEQDQLPALIASMYALKVFPHQFIFVDDHSEDNSVDLLKPLDQGIVPVLVLKLGDEEHGKKAAIRKALASVKTSFFLTWDADITIQPAFFEALQSVPVSDLTILPVAMKAEQSKHFFYELDYYFLNAISFGLSGIMQPIVASGANLLINREKFEKLDSLATHQHIASGDDMFTLADFKSNGASIAVRLQKDLIAETHTPTRISEFLNQRIRWIKKTPKVNDKTAIAIGVLGFLVQLFFLLALSIEQKAMPILFKILADLSVFLPYLILLRRTTLVIFVPIFALLYPFYTMIIPVLTLFFKPTWKKRED